MTLFLAGLAVFFGAHLFSTFRSREEGRDLKQKLGYATYMGLYSLISLIGLVLIVQGYAAMRPSEVLYVPPVWMQHINLLLMVPALILLVASNMPAGKIKVATKHPMLAAVKLWALGHLLANGELNSVILFGSFLVYAVIDRIAVKKRGDNGPAGPGDVKWDIAAVVVGLALYGAIMMWLHPILFGVDVMPA